MCQCCAAAQAQTEKDVALKKMLAKYQGQVGVLIPVLQEAQNIYGYLPQEVMYEIAKAIKVPPAKLFGVATFYAQFHLKPRGRNIIRVCLGTACHVRGGAKIMEEIQKQLNLADGETSEDLRYTLESVACIGACGLAPVIMINDDAHGRLTPDKIKDILARYE